jgi:hypothetical protein
MKVNPKDMELIQDAYHQVLLTRSANNNNISCHHSLSTSRVNKVHHSISTPRVTKVPRRDHHSSVKIQVKFFLFDVFIFTSHFDLEASFFDNRQATSCRYSCNSPITKKQHPCNKKEV